MGMIYAEIELINTYDIGLALKNVISQSEIRRQKVTALVDSGSYMLAINEHLQNQLELEQLDEQEAILADGTIRKVNIVGPVDIRFENRATTVRAVVIPGHNEVLLGAIPMEDMDVLIDPKQQKLVVNPENPYLAKKSLK